MKDDPEMVSVGGKDYLLGQRDRAVADAIKDAGHEIAEAIVLLARATAGEFDQGEEVEPATDLTGRPLR